MASLKIPRSLIALCLPWVVAVATLCAQPFGMYPEWSENVSIYEVNVRQFSEEGSFDAVTEYLPEIKAMGIDLVWLMPIHEIGEKNRKGPLGSYYSIKDYKSVNPEFGTHEDFKRLVDRAHELGMYVILDWVANHTAWDHHWTETNPEFYNTNEDGEFIPPVADWFDVIDLNFDNRQMRAAMIDAMAYWVREFELDGYRCDVAEKVPTDFWNEARAALNEIRPVFMLAEGQYPEFHEEAFEASYAWTQMGKMRELVAGKINAGDLVAHEEHERREYSVDAIRMKFLSNHDENTWHATVEEDYGPAAGVLRAFTVASRGMPLIYNGEEAGLDKQLEFFEKDPIVWRDHPERERITRLLKWKQRNKALWNGSNGGDIVSFETKVNDQVWAFWRGKEGDKIIAILNLSPKSASFTLWDSALAGDYTDVLTDEGHSFSAREHFSLGPWDYLLLEAR